MKLSVVVLGAGFGGLELTSILSEALGENLDLTLIDQHNHFYFGFSKLDVMFGRKPADAVKIPYASIVKPGVRFKQDVVTGIDPDTRAVTTQNGSYNPDVLVVALGANYDIPGTPGLADGGNEYYSFAGAEKLRDILPGFTKGNAVVGVCGAPFKCPPAPSEGALMLHDYLTARGVRENCTITLVMPFGIPIPPSPDSSKALLASFNQRGITFVPDRVVKALDHGRRVVIAKDTKTENIIELPYDLFLGIPRHVAPDVILKSGLAENGWIPVARENLMTKFPNVYAIGDVTSVGTPKAGVFAEGAAKVAAAAIIANFISGKPPAPYAGTGSCYIEFGEGKVGRVDVDFFSGPKPVGIHYEPTMELVKDKEHFGSSRKSRWFGK